MALMMYGVVEHRYADVELHAGEESVVMPAVAVTLEVVDTETMAHSEQVLIVPQAAGPALLAALLTEDQYDTLAGGA